MRWVARRALDEALAEGSRWVVAEGFSLVELLFALLVFQVGVLGVAGMVLMAQQNLMRAEITARGVLEAQLAADSVRDAGSGGSGSATHAWGQVSWGPAPDVPGGVRAVAVSNHGGDTVAAVTVWPGPVVAAGSPMPAKGAVEAGTGSSGASAPEVGGEQT